MPPKGSLSVKWQKYASERIISKKGGVLRRPAVKPSRNKIFLVHQLSEWLCAGISAFRELGKDS